MIIVIAAVLAVVAFVVLFRLLWLSARPDRYSTLITLAAAALVIGLAVLALTGRLHWLAAVAAAVAPFLRRAGTLLRHLPLLGSVLGRMRSGGSERSTGGAGATGNGTMTRAQALEVLGLDSQPTREEIKSAHRRLIQRLHPDRGGSKYLAQQLNDARDRLLRDL